MVETEFDIIVIGAGPAGLSSAISAASDGKKVAVFEKGMEIGYPIHTSGASWVDELEKLKVPSKFYHPIKRGILMSTNKKAVFEYPKPVSCILDVRAFYQHLAKQASLQGAKIFVNSEVTEPIIEDGFIRGVRVRRNGDMISFKANVVIDGSGFSSITAKRLGWFKGFERFGKGAEYDLFAPSWDQDEVCLLFGSRIAPHGYGWIFPHGDSRVRVGVGIIHPLAKDDPKRCLDGFLFSSNPIDKRLEAVSCVEFHRGLIPSQGPLERTVSDGLIIVGDAAGQISPIVGEGIRFALDIGSIAGSVASRAIDSGDYSEDFLSQYDIKWRKKYERKFKLGLVINRRIAEYSDEKWDEKIEILSNVKPNMIPYILKGDFSAMLLAKLLVQHPLLVGRNTLKVIHGILKRK